MIPICNNEERALLLENCKWVDGVIRDTPYVLEVDYLDKFGLDYLLHGDDICYDENGESIFSKFEKIGRFK